jgi:PAS domain S-box-containing protein
MHAELGLAQADARAMGYHGVMSSVDDTDGSDARDHSHTADVVALIAEFDRRISHLSFAEVARGALSFMSERLGLARVSVALVESAGQTLRIYDSTTVLEGVESGKLVPFDAGTMGPSIRGQITIYRATIPDTTENVVDVALLAAGYRSSITVPLLAGGRCIGTLNAAAVPVDGIGLVTRQVMELLAPRMAFAIHAAIVHELLAESETRFRDVFANVGDGVMVADVSNRQILMANEAMGAMLGRSVQELLGLTVTAVHPAARIDEVIATFVSMVEGHLDHALGIPMLRADGTIFLADVTARHTTVSGKACVVGVFRDAANRRQREQEQVQLQKLESIRTLAAGIAHDFNNLLTGLIGYMSLVQPHLTRGSEPWQMLDEAQRAAFRASGLTRQLLTFAKGGAPIRQRTDLVQLVQESARLAASGSNVQCRFELPRRAVPVMGDEGQLAQVVQNLVRNAVEAMPGGGTARIKISVGPSNPIGKGEEACIEVSDDGTGIAPALLDRVFVPFFTTKASGSGLGLAAAYSIVRAHAGRISVVSEQGVGTTFTIFLPMAEAPDEAVTTPETASTPGTGVVLVMDDQAVVRHVAERALREAGYDTCLVGNGDEAIAAYRRAVERRCPFAAVILDLTVPGGMGGREVAHEILALDPGAKLIVSSGYSEDAVMSDHRRHGFCAVLPKPYGAEQLRAAVARVLRPPLG